MTEFTDPSHDFWVQLFEQCPGLISSTIERDGLSAQIQIARSALVPALSYLRDVPHGRFKSLIDLFGADYPERAERFEIIYNLSSMHWNKRLIIKIQTSDQLTIPSAVSVYPAAGWYEREIWDMYGVVFDEHPDLRRILTDYGFVGHPLRKDFPVSGYVEVRYDPITAKVIYEPIQLVQEFRQFDFVSPWSGPNYSLPGDEKAS
jgi:NADH-quinone oxidoreductase subunit C